MLIASAGILLFRRREGRVEALLSHPGGPFWAKKDDWSIPKGELDEGEDHWQAACREFEEELGSPVPDGDHFDLGSSTTTKKHVYVFAREADFDVSKFHCPSMATMEWPPKSGQEITFPENDRVEWFELSIAKAKVFKNQAIFIDRLAEKLGVDVDDSPTQSALF